MNSDSIRKTEARHLRLYKGRIEKALRTGAPVSWEWVDELEVLAMHTDHAEHRTQANNVLSVYRGGLVGVEIIPV